MASKHSYRIEKKWVIKQLRQTASLNSREVQKHLAKILKKREDEKDTTPQYLTARDLTFDKVVEIFGLKEEIQTWYLRKEDHDVPKPLIYNLEQLKEAPYDKNSEAYNRIAIDYLIIACMAKHKKNLSKQSKKSKLPANDSTTAISSILKQSELPTNDPHDQIATIVPVPNQATEIAGPSYVAPTTPLIAPERSSQHLPIKVFPEMSLAVQVKRGSKEWLVSGIADWTMGYGDRAVLEDRAVLLAIEAKRKEHFSNAEGQLLAYLATIRQRRIQANKENVMTQGFYSDGRKYVFLCIRNDGTVMESHSYDTFLFKRELKSVFNFLLGMLTTAADSSPNTSPIKPGLERDEKIKNLDRDVFVEVVEDQDVLMSTIYHDDNDDTEEDEWSDISISDTE